VQVECKLSAGVVERGSAPLNPLKGAKPSPKIDKVPTGIPFRIKIL